ncbi:LysR family transcriptional regulator [Actinomadura sp. LCR2-06]|uniref:LysR family transcriptional regulator n=2 Tax=Actinomadura violacea TaxID=2819934 RepID=A0ABS3S3C8_9ACTN|nr:LysR family transcriptional regulator [Actinomadura violacea]
MELRDIEIFLALAEELHFGRTAARLHVTQARISQAIGQQERRLGGALFDRSNRRQIRLTPLGRQLRDDLTPVYAGLRDSLERARLAARGITAVLRIGLMPFNIAELHPYWKRFRELHPQWQLQIRPGSLTDPFAGLRTGDVDVLVAWLPVEEPDLIVGPALLVDRRILGVAADHELAERSSVPLDAFADHPQASAHLNLDYWEDQYLPFYTPSGHAIERSEFVADAGELINLVATGEIVHPFPGHVTRYWSLPHITWIPIPAMPTLTYALIWRADAETDAIRALAGTVRKIGPTRLDER